jgi:DUF1680 family protein
MHKLIHTAMLAMVTCITTLGQTRSLVNTSQSHYVKLYGVDVDDVRWTGGFWAERFAICRDSMIPKMWNILNDSGISHSYTNFEIAAGKVKGVHQGPPFHDGDFYKWFEGMVSVYAITHDAKTDSLMGEIISTLARAQREDGYIHTPVIIEMLNSGKSSEFKDRLNFETYNMGHLMTAACIHYRATGKTSLLNIACKAADFLNNFYLLSNHDLARNAICPSHYMGIIELYRTTGDRKYLELARNLIGIRGLVQDGTDDNQDRIPFRQQTKAIGHAVRANYLYAGAADVYAETGDTSLLHSLNLIWNDLVLHKMYITGGCGALYDGVSPDGTSYNPSEIQKVHQAYGRDYQLPNITAHNESCANIGNLIWNWRMLLITGEAKYADVMELVMYNSMLAGVSLDGKRYFYTNPLCVNQDLPYTLRWSKDREEYISYCNCCPPNTVRTIAEIHNYVYSLSDDGVYINLYGSNKLNTSLKDGTPLQITQQTNYPWDGSIKIILGQIPDKEWSVFLRIPGWCDHADVKVNQKPSGISLIPGKYAEIKRKWHAGDVIELNLTMEVKLLEANPLVEETRNQVAIKRGPVVYCLESADLPDSLRITDITIPSDIYFRPIPYKIANSELICLEGQALAINNKRWQNTLYREITKNKPLPFTVRLIPYYAWNNRGSCEMTVWLPLTR